MRFDPIRVVEACYAPADDDDAWLARLSVALAPAAPDQAIHAILFTYEDGALRDVTWRDHGPARASAADVVRLWSSAPRERLAARLAPLPAVDTLARRAAFRAASPDDAWLRFARAHGWSDALLLLALDPLGRGVSLSMPSPHHIHLGPRLRARLTLLSAHLATAHRLRRRAAEQPEAVLDPSGKVHHAEGEARGAAEREALAAAVRRSERARGTLRRSDPDEALGLWRGLVDGRWSLVDHVEAGGRRVLLARRNAAGARDPVALSPRERDVLAHVAQGHSNKFVGYALGLSSATVASHLRSALAKLRLRTRREAIALLGPLAGAPGEGAGGDDDEGPRQAG
ncbi:MAG: LuxR C-terminal-related transcriptional regulator [Anaeromyxobacter sp.]